MIKHITSFLQGIGTFIFGVLAFAFIKLLVIGAFGVIVWIAWKIHEMMR